MEIFTKEILAQLGLYTLALFLIAYFIIRYLSQQRDKRTDAKIENQQKDYQSKIDQENAIFQSKLDNQHAEFQAQFRKQEQERQARLNAKAEITKEKYNLELEIYQEIWEQLTKLYYQLGVYIHGDLVMMVDSSVKEKQDYLVSSYDKVHALLKKAHLTKENNSPFYSVDVHSAINDYLLAASNFNVQLIMIVKRGGEPEEWFDISKDFHFDKVKNSFNTVHDTIRNRLNEVQIV